MAKNGPRVASDDEETLSLVREAAGDNGTGGSTSTATNKESKSGGAIWKVLVLIVAGIVILLATDSIELKIANTAGASDHPEGLSPPPESSHHDVLPSATNVETKEQIVSMITRQPPSAKTPAEQEPAAETPLESPAETPLETPAAETPPETPAETPAKTLPAANRLTYKRRGQPMSDEERQKMSDKWGSWTLVDDKERPQEDYYEEYPNRDIPRSKFPSNAWQIDKDYLDNFLPEAIALAQRAQEAILAEYGKTEGPWENRTDMFQVEMLESLEGQTGLEAGKGGGRPSLVKGGWTTTKSWEGFVRRVLHAVMTEDMFVFAMGGHSAAAGHGNHFQQSYTLQVQWILEAVFARLRVRHQARNFGNGGLGTLQNSLSAGTSYGPDVDVMMWDSSMTEQDGPSKDLFHRQAIMGGIKVPILWSLAGAEIKLLNIHADVDVGFPGTGHYGIKVGETLEEINEMPWASQYVLCNSEMSQICRQNEYKGVCWIDRDDFTPPTKQKAEPGGRAKWHPGNRKHQVTGRVLTFTILQALKEAMTLWKEADNYDLPDDAWHVTALYEKSRANVAALGADIGHCPDYEKSLLGFACNYTVKGRQEFTGRAYPPFDSIRSLMPPEQAAAIDKSEPNIYEAPDVFNPNLHPPPGAIDVLNIVEAGVDFTSNLVPDYTHYYKKPSFPNPPKLPVGKGIRLNTAAGDDFCDSSVDSFCNRGMANDCLLYGHNDGRYGYLIDGYSGWLVMNVPDVKNGYIVVNYQSWQGAGAVKKTDGWNSINNEARRLGSNSPKIHLNSTRVSGPSTNSSEMNKRKLKNGPLPFCDEFRFEYAIDGKVTSLNLTEWQAASNHVQRVVEVLTILDDPSYTGGIEKEIEIAVRITGCAQIKTFSITHVYWS